MSAAAPKRIVVALDPSLHARAALEAAADLAARLHAELVGLYVEDIDLLNVAALPFAREYTTSSAAGRTLDPGRMARVLRGQADRLRKAIEEAASRTHVPWSFRVMRGRVAHELVSACCETDLLVVGRDSRSSGRRVRVGTNTRRVLRESMTTVVVLHEGASFARPVLIVFDGSAPSVRALVTAARLAQADHHNIVVALLTGDDRQDAVLRDRAAAVLGELGLAARYAPLRSDSAADLVAVIEAARCRTLVVPADSPVLAATAAPELLERLTCPIVLVR